MEYAGEVESVGPASTMWPVGSRVMGIIGGGAHAEYVCVHEREVLPIPSELSFEEAAAIPEVFLTAYDALFRQLDVRIGERILVHAIGSGVGTATLQLGVARRRDGVRHVALGVEARAGEGARPRARDRRVVEGVAGAGRGARGSERSSRRGRSRGRRLSARQPAAARAARTASRRGTDGREPIRSSTSGSCCASGSRSSAPRSLTSAGGEGRAGAGVLAADHPVLRVSPTPAGDRAGAAVRSNRRRTRRDGVELDVRKAGAEVVIAARPRARRLPTRGDMVT